VTATAKLGNRYRYNGQILPPTIPTPFKDVFNWTGVLEYDFTESLFVKVVLHYEESGSGLQTLQQLGITNPVGLIWELIPYSFIVDWFVPIGDYLSSLDRFLGKDFVKGCICKAHEWDGKTKVTALSSQNYPTFQVQSFECPMSQTRVRHYRRDALQSFPSNSLPTLNVNVNTNRMLDAISILLQRRGQVNGFKGNLRI
jgi:hypothetical protein